MLSFFTFTRLHLPLSLTLAAALAACGGGNSEGNLTAAAASAQVAPLADRDTANFASSVGGKGNFANPKAGASSADHHPTRVLAKIKPTTLANEAKSQATTIQALGLKQISGFAVSASTAKAKAVGQKSAVDNNLAMFEITDPAMNVAQAVDRLKNSGMVVYAEPDYYIRARLAPNDDKYGVSWHLKNTGQVGSASGLASSGVAGNDINAESAWNTTTGNGSVVVAVIDSGVKYDHPDLAPNMWSSAGTPRVIVASDVTGQAGVVDDANGVNIATLRGSDTSLMPYNSDASDHGTMVSGFVGARGNNTAGVTGVAWNVKIMGIKIESPDPANYGGAFTSSLANGVYYAIAKKRAGVNVRVMNISYGGPSFSNAYFDAVSAASAEGILIAVAAGNDGSSDPAKIGFPTGYATSTMISVGSISRDNTRSSFSNFGSQVHLFAPGDNVPTTSSRASGASGQIEAYYRYINGTSFSSPIVAGAAALLMMQYPSETALQIKQRLLAGVTPFFNTAFSLTAGKLNLGNSMQAVVPCSATPPTVVNLAQTLVQGATHKANIFIKTCAQTGVVTVAAGTEAPTAFKDDGIYPDDVAGDGIYGGSFVAPRSTLTSIPIEVIVKDNAGNAFGAATVFRGLRAAANYSKATIGSAWDAPLAGNDFTSLLSDPDDGALTINSPFPVTFDGRSISRFYMSSNGYLCMDNTNCISGAGTPLPGGLTGALNGMSGGLIAPWWNDWIICPTTSGVSGAVLGASPNRRIVLTWRNVLPWYQGISCSTATDGVSFQVAMYEGNSNIDFRYNDVAASVPAGVTVSSAGALGSGGIQLSGGKMGTKLFHNVAGSVAAGSSYRFAPTSASFTDVYPTDFFAVSTEGLRGSIITTGCTTTLFCADFGRDTPDKEIKTTQIQMAAFLSRAILGHDSLVDYSRVAASGYADVVPSYAKYVNLMKLTKIMSGTGGSPTSFCNGDCNLDFVTRAQMARYLVKSVRGDSYVPQAAIGRFPDVPTSHPEARFIEEVARMKITLGKADGNYGPDDFVTRGQMATFLQRTFRPLDPY